MSTNYSILIDEINDFATESSGEALYRNQSRFQSLASLFEDKMLLIRLIREGISLSLFELISSYLPFTKYEWANFLDISLKSLKRYEAKSDHKFKSIHSEKIIELAEVTFKGIEVFGSLERFKLWLSSPYFPFSNERPSEFLHDSYGKELLLAELIRIDHGILS